MENIVINTGGDEFSQVVSARHALVGGLKNTGKFIKGYAEALELAFNVTNDDGSVTKWYDLKGKAKRGIKAERDADRKSTRLNSSHIPLSRMPSSA